MSLETYFKKYRRNIVGIDREMALSDGNRGHVLYADWIASGRLYGPLEEFMLNEIGPLVANTHTETTYTGTAMTQAYHEARDIIKKHVNASKDDSLILSGFGMTAAINKLQRILGLRMPEGCEENCKSKAKKQPLVLITHMEHHSNQISWEECQTEVQIIPRNEKGLPDLNSMRRMLERHGKDRQIIGAFTACSNVTGIVTPYHEMAEIIHDFGGACFVDFAASAPYVDINMHPPKAEQALDAVLFSPHKFMGGPGSSGVLVMNNHLYKRTIPDQPGGGTVLWTTPFGTHEYSHEIEVREDGGTPGFLQAIRIALAIRLKESMGTGNIRKREEELKNIMLEELKKESSICLLEPQNMDRLGIISFYALSSHYNLIVKLLNDRFGIQTRGGCSCAGTYGHILFNIDQTDSQQITEMINQGDLSDKPGWVRISLHPTMTDHEARFVGQSVVQVVQNYDEWKKDYLFHRESGEFTRRDEKERESIINQFSAL